MHISDLPLFSPLLSGLNVNICTVSERHRWAGRLCWKSSIQMIYLITIMDYACYFDDIIMESERERGLGSLVLIELSHLGLHYLIFITEKSNHFTKKTFNFWSHSISSDIFLSFFFLSLFVKPYLLIVKFQQSCGSFQFFQIKIKPEQHNYSTSAIIIHAFGPFSCCLHW